MNSEQAKSAVRSIVIGAGCLTAGFFAARGMDSSGTLTGIFTSEAFASFVTSMVFMAWGIWTKTNTGLITAAANLPEVKKIEVTSQAMAADINPNVKATVTTPNK